MRIRKIKFILFILLLTIIQLLINSFNKCAVDILGVFLVILLSYGFYSLRFVISISLLADLFGHWYLGSHLLCILIIGVFISNLVNYFKISSFIQKLIIIIAFYSLLIASVTIVNGILKNYTFGFYSYLFEIILLCPIILALFDSYIVKLNASEF